VDSEQPTKTLGTPFSLGKLLSPSVINHRISAKKLNRFSYHKKPISNVYEALKCLIGSALAVLCVRSLIFGDVESGFSVALLAIVGLGLLFNGSKSLLQRDKQLPFVEIDEELIRYRNVDNFGVSAIKTADIEFVIVGGDRFEIAHKGFSGVSSIEYRGIVPNELCDLFETIAPEAKVKLSGADEED